MRDHDESTRVCHFRIKEKVPDMALLDLVVDGDFRREEAGLVVIFPGCRDRGYVVKSEGEELRIRSFLKMFYFAHFSILILGSVLAFGWARELSYAFSGRHAFLFTTGVALGIYSLVAGIPYILLWRSYKNAFLNFVSVQDEVAISGMSARRRPWIVSVVLIALAILIFVGVMSLIRRTSVAN